MILLCGIPTEPPLAFVRRALDSDGLPYLEFNQRAFDTASIWFEISGGGLVGELRIGTVSLSLTAFSGVYTRLMDDRLLPELRDQPPLSSIRRQCRAVHETLQRWIDIAPVRVVNRTAAMLTNGSKPLQAQMIRAHGFAVPETVVTNDPERVRQFCADKRRVVYKSISGIRSIVREVSDGDLARLDHIRWCPVQFQEFVDGTDVRVHVVGDEVFASRISSSATDYRYGARDGEPPALTAYDLGDAIAARCVALAVALDLPFAGIDLRLAPDGTAYCFEVNPSPGFSFYESRTGQPIARALAHYLAAG